MDKIRVKLNSAWRSLAKWPAGISVAYSAIYILLVYRNNVFDVPPGEVVAPLVLALAFVYASYYLFRYLIKDWMTAEIVTLIFTVLTVHFGTLFRWSKTVLERITGWETDDVVLGSIFLMAGFGLCLAIGLIAKRSSLNLKASLTFLQTGIFSFLAVTLLSIGYFYAANWRIFTFDTPQIDLDYDKQAGRLPDVYYFVFDRYANNETLKEYYGFDNQEFIDELKKRSFSINDIEHSNYQSTATSLASTFNMDYLDRATAGLPPKYSEMMYGRMIKQSDALRELKDRGYQINWSGSWWGPTRTNKVADNTFDGIFKAKILGGEFTVANWQELFLGQHVLGRFLAADLPLVSQLFHYDQPHQRDIVNHQFDSVKKAVDSEADESRFSFFHLLTPHPLYVFDRDGSVPDYHQSPDIDDVPEKEKYVNQLVHINQRILESVDYILEHSDQPPIIIFQPDEGPYLFSTGEALSEREKIRWKHGVLSAFYLPGYEEESIELSPVNLFRYMLNEYMGYEMEYLPHRAYSYSKSDPYNFKEITSTIFED